MTDIRSEPDGRVVVETSAYRLEVAANGLRATLSSPRGEHRLTLRPLAAVDTAEAPDETVAVEPPRVADGAIEVARTSTVWDRASVALVPREDALEVHTRVTGRGTLDTAHLLALRSLVAGEPTGFMPSGSRFRALFTPNPEDPVRLVRGAAEAAVVGVTGDGQPGRGRWLFTPAPLYLALTTAEDVVDPSVPVAEGWLDLALHAPVTELTFVDLAYVAADGGFSLALSYEGHTAVDGELELPAVVLTPGVSTPYAGIRRHRDELVRAGLAPVRDDADTRPAWWSEPIFCGWGAQCHLATTTGRRPADLATQERYDAFLERLEDEGVVPGTVVLDDKWQAAYGTNEPDRDKWPDLGGWIAARHARGQRVLLWWKAWDPEGLPAELCVRAPDGRPVAVDPTSPAARAELRRVAARMLAPDGLDADGLKVDFTARTPSGRALVHHGPAWGIALLYELLDVVYRAAKEAKPDALVITQTPHPSFADVADMIRLNDMLRTDQPSRGEAVVPQMRYRAAVAAAASPELLVDTDDWALPDLATWRAYLEAKPELGVPSLYYATHIDVSGEAFTGDDYDALRRTWAAWREGRLAPSV
jgi:hypothetical protein